MGVQLTMNVTAFPSGLNVAATFDKNLMEEYGRAMGKEFRELGVNIQLGPAVNLMRAPAAGRNWEGPGGDPYLASISSSRIVRGIQSNGVIASVKHLIGNEQEIFRERASSNIDKRTLMEVYMAPFDACIKEGVGAIMCSYNKLNQVYTCANSELMDIIKSPDLDFRGIVLTDWYAKYSLMVSDLVMPGAFQLFNIPWWKWTPYLSHIPVIGQFFPQYQTIPDERLDDMATRILSTYYQFGQDEGFPNVVVDSFSKKPKGVENRDYRFKEHALIARNVAAASTIVVKNDGVLPLKNSADMKLAILGEDARAPKLLNEFSLNHGVDGTVAQGWGSGTALFPYLISPFEGISSRATNNNISSTFDNQDLDRAREVARDADVAVVFASASSGELILAVMNIVEGNWGDRKDLKLWHGADALIEAVASVNKKTVVVLHTVGPVDMPWFNHPNISAVIFALLPGQESGAALAQVLFGDVNPSGRLPFTVMKNRAEYTADVIYHSASLTPQINYSEGLCIDYRYADKFNLTPVIPFGHGLSYTTFEYSSLVVDSTPAPNQFPTVSITVSIKNTGPVAGHEVVQLYVAFPEEADEPPKILKGFEKVWVEVGETVQVAMELSPRDLRVWKDDSWVNIAGVYGFKVGASSRDIRIDKEVELGN
ncbi:UNVERIFIED_CONTAM: hypothetical protein HDU68_003096 [Siphonaria sp. JEL0065]|nr:hypothetical protein HDU68_003096 [Siphonaria sp. JEL0065]